MRLFHAAFAAGLVALAGLTGSGVVQAQEREATLAGVAYSGAHDTIEQRFEHTRRYMQSLEGAAAAR